MFFTFDVHIPLLKMFLYPTMTLESVPLDKCKYLASLVAICDRSGYTGLNVNITNRVEVPGPHEQDVDGDDEGK